MLADFVKLISFRRPNKVSAGLSGPRGNRTAILGSPPKAGPERRHLGSKAGVWSRFECKYRISEVRAAAIEKFISPYLHLDRYSRQSALGGDGFYDIVSLYLDSDTLQLYKENLHGSKNRFKLRIRSYSGEASAPCFFEIKRRVDRIIIKSRVSGKRDDVVRLFAGRSLPARKFAKEEEILRQFQLYMHSICAKPMILIRYRRKAYESDTNNRVRVTFDKELSYKVTDKPEVVFDGPFWQSHPFTRNGVILEIKFTGSFPIWLSQMTGCFDLRQQSVSKYATSLKHSINQSALGGFIE